MDKENFISKLEASVEADNVIEISLSDNENNLLHFTAADNWPEFRRQINQAIDIWEESEPVRKEKLSSKMTELKSHISSLSWKDTIYDIFATSGDLDQAIKNGAESFSKQLAMRLVWLIRRREELKRLKMDTN